MIDSKAIDDPGLFPQPFTYEGKKVVYRLTEEEKVTLDIDQCNILTYAYLDPNFSKYCFLLRLFARFSAIYLESYHFVI